MEQKPKFSWGGQDSNSSKWFKSYILSFWNIHQVCQCDMENGNEGQLVLKSKKKMEQKPKFRWGGKDSSSSKWLKPYRLSIWNIHQVCQGDMENENNG